MELLHITTAPPERNIFHAGFWQRGLAKLIDFFILGICLLPFDIAFGTSLITGGVGHENHDAQQVFVFVLFCLYSAILESSKQQATFGKRLMGILVTDLNEGRISFGAALLRSLLQVFAPFDYILAIFTERKQTLHDFVVNTQVLPGSL